MTANTISTVIKAGQTAPILRRLTTVDLADHLAEARAVIESAKRRAALILAQAESEAGKRVADAVAEADEARRSGQESGFHQGREEGLAAGAEAARRDAAERFAAEQVNLVTALQGAVRDIENVKETLRVTAERDVVDFALRIARKLTFATAEVHREAAVENLRRALKLVDVQTSLTIHVNPVDMETARQFAPAMLETLEKADGLRILSDESISPGGCIVEGPRTRVDATLETQAEELIGLLLGEAARHA